MADPQKIVAMNRAMGLNDDGSEKKPAAKAAAPAPAEEHPTIKAAKDLVLQLHDLLNPKAARQPTQGGKTVDQSVDEAVSGGIEAAKKARPEY